MNEALKDEHWICGQRFTIADAYLFTVLRWAYAVKLNLEGLEHIAAFMQRMAERPEVQDALSAEGLKYPSAHRSLWAEMRYFRALLR